MHEVLELMPYAIARVHQASGEIVEALHAVFECACQGSAEADLAQPQLFTHFAAIGAYQLRRSGRRRCANIGNEIDDRKIRFVSDAGNDRDGARGNRARERLLVVSPQVFDAAAAAAYDQNIALGTRACSTDRVSDSYAGAIALNRCGIDDNVDARHAAP